MLHFKKVLWTVFFALMLSGCQIDVIPTFDADVADNSVVKISNLSGGFLGTGFYIDNDAILTVNHMTEEENRTMTPYGWTEDPPTELEYLLVSNKDGEVALGMVTYKDQAQDVATIVLFNNFLGLSAVKFAESDPKRGDTAFMIGHPAGFPWTLSRGYIALKAFKRKNGIIRGLASLLGIMGSSGSPIFNERGEVVGIASEMFKYGSGVMFIPNDVFRDKVTK